MPTPTRRSRFAPKKLTLRPAPDDAWPICPHCRKELHYLWVRTKGLGIVQFQQFVFCPHCRAFLGFNGSNAM